MARIIPLNSAPGVLERDETAGSYRHGYVVVVYDNEHNTFDEVMMILMLATGCDEEEAAIETWEVHHLGKSVVHHGSREECEAAAEIIAKIDIQVEVREE